MAITRNKVKARQEKGRFLSLPHCVLNHIDFLTLKPRSVRLLIDIAMQYNGSNNGDLCAVLSLLKKRGWTSNDQLNKAKRIVGERIYSVNTARRQKNS